MFKKLYFIFLMLTTIQAMSSNFTLLPHCCNEQIDLQTMSSQLQNYTELKHTQNQTINNNSNLLHKEKILQNNTLISKDDLIFSKLQKLIAFNPEDIGAAWILLNEANFSLHIKRDVNNKTLFDYTNVKINPKLAEVLRIYEKNFFYTYP